MHSGLPYVHPGALRVHEHTEAVSCVHLYTNSVFVCTLVNTSKVCKHFLGKGAHLNTVNNYIVHSDYTKVITLLML